MSTPTKSTNVRFGASSYAAASRALYTPSTPYTPAVSCATPAILSSFGTARQLIHRGTPEFDRLQHRALAINVAKLESRKDNDWRKSGLTDEELYYLWCDASSRCMRIKCGAPLTETSMSIEHIIPKDKFPKGKWDLRNLTILCGPCNAKKREFHINSQTEMRQPSLAGSLLMAIARGGGW